MSPPKIEVLDDVIPKVENDLTKIPATTSRKNPFAQTKKKTIRRDAKDLDLSYRNQINDSIVASNEIKTEGGQKLRHGLNVPDYVRDTPIDKLFAELEDKIMSKPFELLNLAYLITSFQVKDRLELMGKLLNILIEIQLLSETEKSKFEDKNLISISLHDIKTFSRLINIIIVHGMYPALSKFKVGIPLDKRRLKSFTNGLKPIQIEADDITTPKIGCMILYLLFEKLLLVFQNIDSDVSNLLLRGTGYSDFLTITLVLLTISGDELSEAQKNNVKMNYKDIINIPDTFELFQTFSLLLLSTSNSGPFAIQFKAIVGSQLQQLHYNSPHNDGLLTLIEFVCGLREQEEVDAEKFDHVANVVLSKPKTVSVVVYFASIGKQIYDLLVNINRSIVNSCVCYVLDKLWLKNQKIVTDFFLKRVWQIFSDGSASEVELNNVINVLISLSKNITSTDLISLLFRPILVNIWLLMTFLKIKEKPVGVLKGLIVSYVVIASSEDFVDVSDNFGLDSIVKNLIADGDESWEYSMGSNGLPQIIERSKNPESISSDSKVNLFLQNLDVSAKLYIELLEDLDDQRVQQEFVIVLERWLKLNNDSNKIGGEMNPFFALIDMRVLEEITNKFKETLAKTPKDILTVVNKFLTYDSKKTDNMTSNEMDIDDADSDDEDEDMSPEQTLPILLQLLSAILTETVEFDKETKTLLNDIKSQLEKITGPLKPAANAVHKRISDLLDENHVDKPKTLLQAQRIQLERAISGLNDPLVPIRAHALHILRDLIVAKSEVISLDFVIELHLVQLKDPEPFIYLNVIKGLQELISWDPEKVVTIYVKIYVNEKDDMDERLRVGEVLLRYIQQENELFSGKCARVLVEGALSLVRRKLKEEEPVDDRLRNSAMSLLGVICNINPIGISEYLGDILDCAIGILKHETSSDQSIMRRSAVVLINDLILGTSKFKNLPFPQEYRLEAYNSLKHTAETDIDLLVRDQAQSVLNTIEELAQLASEGVNKI